jgi:hypothetical protein
VVSCREYWCIAASAMCMLFDGYAHVLCVFNQEFLFERWDCCGWLLRSTFHHTDSDLLKSKHAVVGCNHNKLILTLFFLFYFIVKSLMYRWSLHTVVLQHNML